MKFEQLYSSSRGNLYTITAENGKRLMIECGVRWDRLQKAVNYDLAFEACLVSHEHKDHSKAIQDVLKAGIDVYSSAGTFEALGISENRRAKPIADQTLVRLQSFEVFAFGIQHDAAEPLGFIVREKATDEFLLFCTDTSHIKQRFKYPFSIIAVECCYDKDVLQGRVDSGDINETLARRLLTSHIEKGVAMRYIKEFCDLSKCRELHLLHLSGDNLDKQQTRKEFEDVFFIKTIIAGQKCQSTKEK